jgi:hypothetical protein
MLKEGSWSQEVTVTCSLTKAGTLQRMMTSFPRKPPGLCTSGSYRCVTTARNGPVVSRWVMVLCPSGLIHWLDRGVSKSPLRVGCKERERKARRKKHRKNERKLEDWNNGPPGDHDYYSNKISFQYVLQKTSRAWTLPIPSPTHTTLEQRIRELFSLTIL